MRPFYETQQDLARETAVAKTLRAAWTCRSEKLPVAHPIDLRLTKNGAEIYAEVKTRTNSFQRYPTYAIAEAKILACRQHPRSILVVQFTDQIRWLDVHSGYSAHLGGRTDRGDKADTEMMAHFKLDSFQPLSANPFGANGPGK